MRVLISGGGLAGLTTAYWLSRHGHEPIVVEEASRLRDGGYGIDFFGTGFDVAERMGIIPALAERQLFQTDDAGIAFVNAEGKPRAELQIDSVREVLDGRYLPLMHGTLVDAVHEVTKDEADIRFATSIASVSQDQDAVRVEFEDGQTDSFDLLVGADGIHSNARALVFGPESEFAHFMGYYVASYFVTGDYDRAAHWDNYVEPGREVGLYSSDRDDRLVSLFLWQAEDEGYVPPEVRGDKLRAAFNDAGWQAGRILDAIPGNGNDMLMDTVTQIRMDTWRRGRVVLVGDAAGCMTLISGQGASMALAGAYVLAQELSETEDWPRALANYEHRVKPQIELRQHKARDFAKQFVPSSKAGVAAQTALMKVITHHAFSGLLKKQFVGESFLQTAALHRLAQSHDNIVGYRVDGRLGETDYGTLEMSLDEVLKDHDAVRLLLNIEHFAGIDPPAIITDWKLGRRHHSDIERLAIVGEGRLTGAMTKVASPLYAKEARHFEPSALMDAWAWLDEGAGQTL